MSGKKANGGSRKAAASFSAVLLGLALMLGLLYALGLPEPLAQVKTLLLSGFSSPEAISRLLVNWAMLTLSGLSISLCWKSGLLNVGVPGQFIAGTMLSMTGALLFSFPWWACLLLGMLGGLVWGGILGAFRVRFQAHEVLVGVMLNWVAVYLSQWLWEDGLAARENVGLQHAAMPSIFLVDGPSVNVGVIIALAASFIIWWVLRSSIFGFELKTAASNPKAAARYGIPTKGNTRIVCCLSGAAAGIGGAICVLSGMTESTLFAMSHLMGFSGIVAGALGFFHPLAVLLSAFYTGCALTGNGSLAPEVPPETGALLLALTLFGWLLLRPVWKRQEK